MRSGNNKVHEYLEKPAMYAQLPNLNNMRVLCLGCGSGEESAYLTERFPNINLVSIDASEELITEAKRSFHDLDFRVMDMHDLSAFEDGSFDFVYSSLVMHYSGDWQAVLKGVHRLLRPGGLMLFSANHPTMWGMEIVRNGLEKSKLLGYTNINGNEKIYGDYFTPRKIKDKWFDNLEVEFYTRPLQDVFADIKASGFELSKFLEPKPIPESKKKFPFFYEKHSRVPTFMIIELRRS